VSDPSEYQERLSATNFDSFLLVLSYFVGGEEKQVMLLEKQVDMQLKLLIFDKCISDQIHAIHKTALGIGASVDNLKEAFWRMYTACEDASTVKFETNVDVSALENPFSELLNYSRLVKILGWEGQDNLIRDRMKELVRSQLEIVTRRQNQWYFESWYTAVHIAIPTPVGRNRPSFRGRLYHRLTG
jgi:hypothetical protein